jgi:hypothetical protein
LRQLHLVGQLRQSGQAPLMLRLLHLLGLLHRLDLSRLLGQAQTNPHLLGLSHRLGLLSQSHQLHLECLVGLLRPLDLSHRLGLLSPLGQRHQ